MSDIRFTDQHEWVRVDGDIATIGITDYAQEQLGDVVFVELPEVGKDHCRRRRSGRSRKRQGRERGLLAGERRSGRCERRHRGDASPAVNEDAMGDGWFVKLRLSNPAELDKLMDEAAYAEFVEGLQ